MAIAIILGTRPEIIKMSPVIRALEKKAVDHFVLHTGQHYSKELDADIFRDLQLQKPKYNLGVGSEPYRFQVGWMTKEIGKILKKENAKAVLVQGDTLSVLSGAMAAKNTGVLLAHHEAGLRSHDTRMLEEVNRVIVDHLSDILFAPTPDALKNLHQEGIETDKIHLTGNTIVDAVNQNAEISTESKRVLEKIGVQSGGYLLATVHRAENVDAPEKLAGIIEGLKTASQRMNLPIIFPAHPRTKTRLEKMNLSGGNELIITEPVSFLEFLQLEKNAKMILTDSGGVQEEAFALGIPCVTVRESTERPETIEHGANVLAGITPEGIIKGVEQMRNKNLQKLRHGNPFGDGRAGERIVDLLIEKVLK